MTLHRKHHRYSPAYARRKLATAEATLATWQALKPRDWRERADRHEALRRWTAEVLKWERVLRPPPIEPHFMLPF